MTADRCRGFALLVVLWVLVLVSFITAQVTASGRTELRIARNLYSDAAAAAAAEGGISEAIFGLSDPRPERAWELGGGGHEALIGRSRVVLRIENEAARINPNLVPPRVLEGLLRATGSNGANARRLATAIAEWVGASFADRPPAKTAAEYRAAGLNYLPPREPMENLDELDRVLGMTPDTVAAIRPYLTLYGPQEPDAVAADPVVVAALEFARTRPGGLRANPPAEQPRTKIARITATAYGPDNAEVSRVAVVRIDPTTSQAATLLAWGASLN